MRLIAPVIIALIILSTGYDNEGTRSHEMVIQLQQLILESPPDKEISVDVGPVVITTYDPVTITGLESSTNLYFTLRNDGSQSVTIELPSARGIQQTLPETILHFFGFQDVELYLEPGVEQTVEYFVSNADEEEINLPFRFRIKETSDEETIQITLRSSHIRGHDLPMSAAIKGKITSETGEPVINTQVKLHLYNGFEEWRTPRGITDSEGSYYITLPSIEDIKAALGERPRPFRTLDYFLVVDAEGYRYAYLDGVAPKRGETLTVDLILQKVDQVVSYRKKGELITSGAYGYWWLLPDKNFSRLAAIQAKHPPQLDKPGHFLMTDLEGTEIWRQTTGSECWGFDVAADGRVVAGCHDGSVYLADSEGRLLWKQDISENNLNREVEFSPDGAYIFTGPYLDKDAALIDSGSGDPVWTYRGPREWLRNSRFSPDGERILAGFGGGQIVMFSSGGRSLWKSFMGEFPLLFETDSDYDVYAAGKSRELFSFDAEGDLRWRRRIPDHVVTAGDMSADGETIALGTVGAWVYVYDGSGNLRWQRRLPVEAVTTGHNAVVMSPDGRWIVVGGGDGTVALYNREGTLIWSDTSKDRRDPSQYTHSETGVMTVAISVDAKYIAAGYGDSTIRIFERETVETPSEGFSKEVTYRSGELTLKGYLCKPQGSGPFPAVVYNHGGLGELIGGAPKETCEALAQDGFVGFSPIRRQTISLEGHIDDVLAGVDYVKRLEYVDVDRLGITGFSRGGLLTFMAATQRSDFGAVVIMAPAPGRGTLDIYLPEAGKVSAPVLILVSENDKVQADHVLTSQKVKEALESAGKQVELIIYPPYDGDGHQMFFEVGDYWQDVQSFLRKHLKPPASPGRSTPSGWNFTLTDKSLLFTGGYADPSVIKMPDGTYLMYLNRRSEDGSGTFILSSNDSVLWREETGIVFRGVAVGRAFRFPEGVRYYYHQPPRFEENRGTIVSSFSPSGITSWEYEGVRVRPREGYGVAGPTVVSLEDGSYRMFFYEAPIPTPKVIDSEIYGATSQDGLSWTRDEDPTIVYEENVEGVGVSPDNPPQVLHPFVMKWPDGGYLMFYNSHNRIFAAYSQDGFTWEKVGNIGIRGADPDAILLPDGSLRIYFGGPDRPGEVFTAILEVEFPQVTDALRTVTVTSTVTSTTTLRTTLTSTTTSIITRTTTSTTIKTTTLPAQTTTVTTTSMATTTSATTSTATATVTSQLTETVGLPAEVTYAAVAVAVIAVIAAVLLVTRRRP